MQKNFKYYAIVWLILLAIFNVAVFVSPAKAGDLNKFGGAFWSGYIGITVAFLGQLAVSLYAFSAKSMQKFFYRIPLIRISWAGLILTLIFGVLAMAIPDLPNWVGIIACATVLLFTILFLIKAQNAAELVDKTDYKVKEQTFFIKSLTVDAQNLTARAKTKEEQTLAKKVYEAVRCSDPMSDAALAAEETQIGLTFNAFSQTMNDKTAEAVLLALQERNNKCKMLK